jgi:geranylgeranyl transferase type-1 subunit beta
MLSLICLHDSFDSVDRSGVLAALRFHQLPDGSFCGAVGPSVTGTVEPVEPSDLRFVYCAACIAHILGDLSALDVDAAVHFIVSSQVQ